MTDKHLNEHMEMLNRFRNGGSCENEILDLMLGGEVVKTLGEVLQALKRALARLEKVEVQEEAK